MSGDDVIIDIGMQALKQRMLSQVISGPTAAHPVTLSPPFVLELPLSISGVVGTFRIIGRTVRLQRSGERGFGLTLDLDGGSLSLATAGAPERYVLRGVEGTVRLTGNFAVAVPGGGSTTARLDIHPDPAASPEWSVASAQAITEAMQEVGRTAADFDGAARAALDAILGGFASAGIWLPSQVPVRSGVVVWTGARALSVHLSLDDVPSEGASAPRTVPFAAPDDLAVTLSAAAFRRLMCDRVVARVVEDSNREEVANGRPDLKGSELDRAQVDYLASPEGQQKAVAYTPPPCGSGSLPMRKAKTLTHLELHPVGEHLLRIHMKITKETPWYLADLHVDLDLDARIHTAGRSVIAVISDQSWTRLKNEFIAEVMAQYNWVGWYIADSVDIVAQINEHIPPSMLHFDAGASVSALHDAWFQDGGLVIVGTLEQPNDEEMPYGFTPAVWLSIADQPSVVSETTGSFHDPRFALYREDLTKGDEFGYTEKLANRLITITPASRDVALPLSVVSVVARPRLEPRPATTSVGPLLPVEAIFAIPTTLCHWDTPLLPGHDAQQPVRATLTKIDDATYAVATRAEDGQYPLDITAQVCDGAGDLHLIRVAWPVVGEWVEYDSDYLRASSKAAMAWDLELTHTFPERELPTGPDPRPFADPPVDLASNPLREDARGLSSMVAMLPRLFRETSVVLPEGWAPGS